MFECKTCAQVLAFGNYFGGTTDSQGGYWPDAQPLAINLKLEQDSSGPTTCDLMEDIIVYKNFGKNLHAGVAVVGRTVGAQSCTVAIVLQAGSNTPKVLANFSPAVGAQATTLGLVHQMYIRTLKGLGRCAINPFRVQRFYIRLPQGSRFARTLG